MLPRNLDLLASIRRQGMRPDTPVIVRIGEKVPRTPIFSDLPMAIEVGLSASVQVAELELWPLHGLSVAIFARSINDHVRAIIQAVCGVTPAFLMVADCDRIIAAWRAGSGWEVNRES